MQLCINVRSIYTAIYWEKIIHLNCDIYDWKSIIYWWISWEFIWMLRTQGLNEISLENFPDKWVCTAYAIQCGLWMCGVRPSVALFRPVYQLLHIYVNVPFMYGIRIIRSTNAYTTVLLYEPEHDVWRKCFHSNVRAAADALIHTLQIRQTHNFVLWTICLQ